MKPYADAAEENKTVVLPVLDPLLKDVDRVLEIGSGTGQQIVYFAGQHPQINWQASDLEENIPGIRLWIEEAGLPNLNPPIALNVAQNPWPLEPVPFIYTSNTLHIMSARHVELFFANLEQALQRDAYLCVYGPFSFNGRHISESNQRFDAFLKQRDPLSGIRDVEDLKRFAEKGGVQLDDMVALPHNNHMLIWRKAG
ncbi:MAG: DUF938 domain-containing protein [Gammaproteobacteria bacterium]|nr:DUF938 domain-containing protein [Gammaproteobacteria bacterium]